MTESGASARLPNRDFRPAPFWWDECPPPEEPPAPLPARCDVAIVGGGIGGLCAALELARHGAAVALLEADAFGFNASTRNSGGVSFGLDLAKVARWARWTGRKGPGIAELAKGALESLVHTEDFIARNAIDCDYHRRGRLSCASTPRHFEALSRRAETLNRLFDANARVLTRSEQHAEIGSERFHGALVIERSGQLNPARYVRGLIRLCEEAKVSRHARTLVQRVERTKTSFRLTTSAGPLEAEAVIVATNAQSARLPCVGLRKRVIPVASHIIVTEPLPEALAEQLIPRRRTGADSRRLLAYFRRTPDGSRFLYGSRAAPFEVSPQRAAEVLYRRMVASFPSLAGVRITHAWGCKVAFTLDALPHMGEIDGVHYLAGCNGNGVAMMTYLGQRVARKLLERARTACVFDRAEFPRVPLYDGRPWFLPPAAAAYRALDFLDTLSSHYGTKARQA
ncbi:MAG TPA: FAD-dependent oxidoreductase [Burkholderiales bacterium]|nr:FAD-dependent oxidoreductase [Burkholderiales bacterium]